MVDEKGEYLLVREATQKGYAKAYIGDSIDLCQPNSQTRRGRVGGGVAHTITCDCTQVVLVKGETDELI